jgi:CheY-like chemotaxis protein
MLVDDDSFTRKLAAKALEGSSYALTYAHDGSSALALLRQGRPDLILMDVKLPDVDGVALTQKLRAASHLADIPALMLTGDARRQTLERSMSAGAKRLHRQALHAESPSDEARPILAHDRVTDSAACSRR